MLETEQVLNKGHDLWKKKQGIFLSVYSKQGSKQKKRRKTYLIFEVDHEGVEFLVRAEESPGQSRGQDFAKVVELSLEAVGVVEESPLGLQDGPDGGLQGRLLKNGRRWRETNH